MEEVIMEDRPFTTIAVDKALKKVLVEIELMKDIPKHDEVIRKLLCETAKSDEEVRRILEKYNVKCEWMMDNEEEYL